MSDYSNIQSKPKNHQPNVCLWNVKFTHLRIIHTDLHIQTNTDARSWLLDLEWTCFWHWSVFVGICWPFSDWFELAFKLKERLCSHTILIVILNMKLFYKHVSLSGYYSDKDACLNKKEDIFVVFSAILFDIWCITNSLLLFVSGFTSFFLDG